MEQLYMYTDGSCLKNPDGPGGWAFILLNSENTLIHKGFNGVKSTSNNKMELTAIIKGFEYILNSFKDPRKIEIFSDSQYVVKGLNAWVSNWIKNNWVTSSNTEVLNKELWIQLNDLKNQLTQKGFMLKLSWVKAHSGNLYNEQVDVLANQAAKLIENFPSEIDDEIKIPSNAQLSIEMLSTNCDESQDDVDLPMSNVDYQNTSNTSGEIIQYSSTMTVKELIDNLKEYDTNSLVFIEYGRLVINQR